MIALSFSCPQAPPAAYIGPNNTETLLAQQAAATGFLEPLDWREN